MNEKLVLGMRVFAILLIAGAAFVALSPNDEISPVLALCPKECEWGCYENKVCCEEPLPGELPCQGGGSTNSITGP